MDKKDKEDGVIIECEPLIETIAGLEERIRALEDKAMIKKK